MDAQAEDRLAPRVILPIFGQEIFFLVVVVVDAVLPGVEVRRRDPFGAAVFAFPGGPAAFFNEAVVGPAGQGECGDVGGPVVFGPALDVVGLTPVARGGAAGRVQPRSSACKTMRWPGVAKRLARAQ